MKGLLIMIVGLFAFMAGAFSNYFDIDIVKDLPTLGLYIKTQIGVLIGIMVVLTGYIVMIIESKENK